MKKLEIPMFLFKIQAALIATLIILSSLETLAFYSETARFSCSGRLPNMASATFDLVLTDGKPSFIDAYGNVTGRGTTHAYDDLKCIRRNWFDELTSPVSVCEEYKTTQVTSTILDIGWNNHANNDLELPTISVRVRNALGNSDSSYPEIKDQNIICKNMSLAGIAQVTKSNIRISTYLLVLDAKMFAPIKGVDESFMDINSGEITQLRLKSLDPYKMRFADPVNYSDQIKGLNLVDENINHASCGDTSINFDGKRLKMTNGRYIKNYDLDPSNASRNVFRYTESSAFDQFSKKEPFLTVRFLSKNVFMVENLFCKVDR